MWFRTPQCSGHTKDLGEDFWQSPDARSLVGTHGGSRESQLERLYQSAWGVLPHPFRTFQMGVTGLKRSPTSAGVPLKLTGTGERISCASPGAQVKFLLCRVFSTSYTSLKSSKQPDWSFQCVVFSSCCIKLGKSWFSNNSKSQFQFWNTVPFILKCNKWWLLRIWLIFEKITISQWGGHSTELLR